MAYRGLNTLLAGFHFDVDTIEKLHQVLFRLNTLLAGFHFDSGAHLAIFDSDASQYPFSGFSF